MTILSTAQVAVSIILIILILLQERSGGSSALFGGGEGSFYQARRGLERWLFLGTLVLTALFAAFSLINLAIR